MKKRWFCLTLALLLCLGSVHAVGEEKFPAVNVYPGYADVKETAWYYDNIRLCNEVGLMNGTDKGFQPEKTLTVAECAAVAARIRASLTGEAIPGVTPLPGETLPWYQQYLGYMSSADATLTPMLAHPEEPCSRLQYLLLLNAALPSEQQLLNAINSITSLPDTDDDTILKFYNAGILTGVDEQGTFDGDKPLTRAECAAMVSRIVRPELRKSFVPAPSPGQSTGSPDTQIALWVNNQAVTAEALTGWALRIAYQLDSYYYSHFGARLSWTDELEQDILSEAQRYAATYAIVDEMAEQLGCTTQELPAALTPSPSQDTLREYIQGENILCAKHILVSDTDTVNAILDGLKSVPTLDQFNALLTVFGTDPGMTANPNGYLFGPGEMVSEFENGVKALEFNSYSTEAVQSTYGYHIIWRLDPLDHPDLISQYRNFVLDGLVEQAFAVASIQPIEEVIADIDLPAAYTAYLESLTARQ